MTRILSHLLQIYGVFSAMLLTALLCFCVLVPLCTADPVFSPQTLTDAAGNQADQDAVITWTELPVGNPYLLSNPTRIRQGLAAFYGMMHGFVSAIFIHGIPDGK